MERKLFLTAVVLAWLALPLTALNYSRAWDRLPTRMAIHFNASWQPNGWTTREGSRMLALGMTAFLLTVFTITSLVVRAVPAPAFSRWAMVAVFYVVLTVVFLVNKWVVDRNFVGQHAQAAGSTFSDDWNEREYGRTE
jgi:uncharacterized membrane protein